MIVHQHFINGEWIESSSTISVVNPSDGQISAQIARGGQKEIDLAVAAAEAALAGPWGSLDALARGRLLGKLSELIKRDAEKLAAMESEDVGKPLTLARNDVTVCARFFEYYAGAADKVHGDTIPGPTGFVIMTHYEPHGVVGIITPWNFPLQMAGRTIAPALAMGNAVVLKPAEDTSLTALALAQLAKEAGFPPGVFNVVTGYGEEAGAALTAHPGLGHISFTGSRAVGSLIQAAASKKTIPVTLELGGKSPQIVFADADLSEAATAVVRSIITNAGQTCSAGSRVLVENKIYDEFVEDLAARFRRTKVGSASQDLDLGPVVNAQQKTRIESYLELARRDKLSIIAEGEFSANLPAEGFYVKPTLIGDVPPNHQLAQEEIFGPVLVVIRVEDEEEAIQIANGTEFGLVAGVWTSDIGRALRISRKIKTGQVLVNNFGVGTGVELPFGGVKGSGHGREKGFEALYGFGTLKTVAIKFGA